MKKTKRQQIETVFHDEYAATVDIETINIYSSFSQAAQEHRHAHRLFKDVKGKKILDLGCGFGETAVFWARLGAYVEGIDISSGMIAISKKLAKKNGVSQSCRFREMAAEKLDFSDNTFDFVFGDGILHHVEYNKTLKEVKRVLKPKGRAVFIEPLAYNPVINIYRSLANRVRTSAEKPLTYRDLSEMKKIFPNLQHQEYECFTLFIFLWFYIVEKIDPNKERYWRKLREIETPLKSIHTILMTIDRFTLRLIPPLRRWCWNTVIELQKK